MQTETKFGSPVQSDCPFSRLPETAFRPQERALPATTGPWRRRRKGAGRRAPREGFGCPGRDPATPLHEVDDLPLGHLCTPEDSAEVVLILVPDASRLRTGQAPKGSAEARPGSSTRRGRAGTVGRMRLHFIHRLGRHLLPAVLFLASALFLSGASLTGTWATGRDDTTVRITTEDGATEGRVVSSAAKHLPAGTVLLKQVKPEGEGWKGQLYAPARKKWFPATLTLEEGGDLRLRVKAGLAHRTVHWERAQ